MFIGSGDYNIDSKGRLVIPSRFKNEIGNETNLFIVRGFDGCISIYKEKEFSDMVSRYQSQSFEKENVRKTMRIFLDSVVPLTIDSQGRILIPTKILEEYGINARVHILGVLDHFEIWDLESWLKEKESSDSEFEKNAQSIFDDGK